MTINYVYDTWELDEMVEEIETVEPWLLNNYFGTMKSFTSEQVEWDLIDGGQRMAPFVSPLVQGRETTRRGFETRWIKPAYIKPKFTIRPTDGFTRLPGEARGGTLSPQARLDRLVADQLREHEMMIMARKEWMAAQALTFGQYLITGEDYPTTLINFGQDPNLRATVGTFWSDPTSNPLEDIENHSLLINETSRGAVIDTLVFPGSVWNLMRQHQDLQDEINKDYARMRNSTIDTGPRNQKKGPMLVGQLSGRFELWVYDDYYEDAATGANTPYLDQDRVLFLSSNIEGRQYQGAIMDLDSGMQAMDVFHKTWKQEDPSGTVLLTQTAPLVGPRRVNSFGTLKIK